MHRKIKNASHNLYKETFNLNSKTIFVYLKSTNAKDANYDSFRNSEYTETYQNPIAVKCIVKQASDSGLIAREIGLTQTGSIYLYVADSDLEIIKNASKLEYNKEFYSIYNKALGTKTLINKLDLGMSRILIFKEGN